MLRSTAIVIFLTVSLVCAGCGYFEHLVGIPEAAPPLGESLLGDDDTLVSRGLTGDPTEPAGQCIPSDTDEPCDDTTGEEPPDVSVDMLAGIWVEAIYGAAAVHIDLDGSIRQVDLADVVAGQPLPVGVPRTLFNVGYLSTFPDGSVSVSAGLSLGGFSAAGDGIGYVDPSLNAIYGMTLSGKMTVLGARSNLYLPNIVWLRWDPLTGQFPYSDDPF